MIEALRNSFRLPDLRNKLLYTLLILVIYQFAAHVPVPGVNREALQSLFNSEGAGLVNVLNLLSGGAVSNFSVIANGVYPYITASIILQLLTPIIPQLERPVHILPGYPNGSDPGVGTDQHLPQPGRWSPHH